jgi:hypothetical protein
MPIAPQPKKYKLLKDLSTAKIGQIYYRHFDKIYVPIEKINLPQEVINENYFDNINDSIVENNPDWFEEVKEKEEKKKPVEPIKNRNGSVVKGLNYGEKYYNYVFTINQLSWLNNEIDAKLLSYHNVFLTKEEAETARKNQEIYNKLYSKIKQIDAENEWVCDWEDTEQEKYCLFYNNYDKTSFFLTENDYIYQGCIYMSEQAKDYMLSNEVSDEEFMIFVNY